MVDYFFVWQFELINTFTYIVFFDNLLYFFIYLKNMLIKLLNTCVVSFEDFFLFCAFY